MYASSASLNMIAAMNQERDSRLMLLMMMMLQVASDDDDDHGADKTENHLKD